MSQQSILEKSLQIRNETQEYANTRGRVANVLDDINETKANRTEVTEEIDEAVEALNIGSKMDRPAWDGSVKYYLVKSDSGANNLQEMILSANRVPVWSGNNLVDSPVYVSSGRVGIGAASVSEVLEVTGNVKANALILPANGSSAIANRLRSDGTSVYYANSSSVERALMLRPLDGSSEKLINSDESLSPKSEFERTTYLAVPLPATALESWKGLIIYFTGSGALTIPNTLSDGWTINGITELSATLSLSLASGKTWRFGTPEAIPEKQIFTITQRVNNFYLLGV